MTGQDGGKTPAGPSPTANPSRKEIVMSKPKKPKKIVVRMGVSTLSPDEKVAHARQTNTVCQQSAAFNASQACKDAMANWLAQADKLEKNQQDKKGLKAQLVAVEDEEMTCLYEYDEGASAFVAAVKATANGDPSIVAAMNVELRADAVHTGDPDMPTGVKVDMLKRKKVPKLEWDRMPGAVMYIAQMSVAPATDTSWEVLYGHGKSRMIPPLVHGQTYLFRVAAVGKDGKPSAWSATVSFVG
jgi:hypothetical protein